MSEYTNLSPLDAALICIGGYTVAGLFIAAVYRSKKSIEFVEQLAEDIKEGLPKEADIMYLYNHLVYKTPFLTPELKETRKELLGVLEQKMLDDPLVKLRRRAMQATEQRMNHNYFSRRAYQRRNARPL